MEMEYKYGLKVDGGLVPLTSKIPLCVGEEIVLSCAIAKTYVVAKIRHFGYEDGKTTKLAAPMVYVVELQ